MNSIYGENVYFQSTEYRDSSITKTGNSTDVDGLQTHLSPDDSADIFCEDSGKYRNNQSNYFNLLKCLILLII